MKILVTGSAGFIGFHLAKRLLDRGDTVVGIDNINDYYDTGLKYARLAETGIDREAEQWHTKVQSTKYENYSFVRMNLEDREQLNHLFEQEKFDKVCNLAAQAGVRYSLENPHAYINSNIVGFINILEACRHNNIKHLAYASSSSVYGNNTKMPLSTCDNVDHPISLYAATKKSNELMAHTYSHLFSLPTTGLRFFTVYGPWGRPDMALFLFTKAILENKPIKVFNNGNMVRDFTYVDDIVEGVVRVIDTPPIGAQVNKSARISPPLKGGVASPAGEDGVVVKSATSNRQPVTPYKIYNIGNSSPVPLMEYIAAIEKTLGRKAQKEFLPMQPGDVPRTEADVTDLVENLGYKPDTPVKVGIDKFINWYKSYFEIQ
jgi:UDP-glucuronate 4-epimerase